MRIGKNPYKGKAGEGQAYKTSEVTICMTTFIPHFLGYYKERFEILKISLASLVKNTEGDFDIMIFDNGSCDEVTAYLRSCLHQGIIDFLVLSGNNLGYNGALSYFYESAPGSIIAYSDDDVFYHPGWLDESLKILRDFPEVGYVTACPMRYHFGNNDDVTTSLPQRHPEIQVEPSEWDSNWDRIHLNSLGANYEANRERLESMDIPIYRNGETSAYPVATHFQYVIRKETAEKLLPFGKENLMSSDAGDEVNNMEIILDKKLNSLGFVKLSTTRMLTEHLGNALSDRTHDLVSEYKLESGPVRKKPLKISRMELFFIKLMNIRIFGRFLRWMNSMSFNLISKKQHYDTQRQAKSK